jgi:hypothetical protein
MRERTRDPTANPTAAGGRLASGSILPGEVVGQALHKHPVLVNIYTELALRPTA